MRQSANRFRSASHSGSECVRRQAGDAKRGEAFVSRCDRSADVDAAASVLDDKDRKAFPPRVLGRVAHAKIEREAGEKHPRQSAFAQISDKSGRRFAVVFVERRVKSR